MPAEHAEHAEGGEEEKRSPDSLPFFCVFRGPAAGQIDRVARSHGTMKTALALFLGLFAVTGCAAPSRSTDRNVNPGSNTAVSKATGAQSGQTVNRATGNLY